MKECCKDQTTPYCSDCGANLKANSLAGLVEELEKRLEAAYKRSNYWSDRQQGAALSDKKKVTNGIVRSLRRVEQLSSWIKQVKEAIDRWDANKAELDAQPVGN